MNIRVRFIRPTVKALQVALRKAYALGDVRLVRRISVLLEYGHAGLDVETILQNWGISRATFYNWLSAFLQHGTDSLVYRHGGGRPAKLTKTQKKRLCELIDAGPQAAGFASACWTTLLIQELIRREFGVLYNRFYVAELLHNLGYSYQKAEFVSDHLDEARRKAWLEQAWPTILWEAKRRGALILFEDEASFAQWGSLSYTWARKGQTPTVKTSGKRKAYKVFGAIELFSGRLFHQGIEGRFNSESYQAFLLIVLALTSEDIFLIQDGARYHTSKAMQQFFAQHRDRLTVFQLPSYSPDYNPIEYLWRKTRKRATHNQYFEQFPHLIESVEATMAYFATEPQEVLALFGLYCHEAGFQLELAA